MVFQLGTEADARAAGCTRPPGTSGDICLGAVDNHVILTPRHLGIHGSPEVKGGSGLTQEEF